MTHEDKQLVIAANTPLLQLVMNREENAFGAVWREVGFQWMALGIIASALAYMRTHPDWSPLMKYGGIVGMLTVIVGMSYVWYERSKMRRYHKDGYDIEEGLSRITILLARNYLEERETWGIGTRQVDAFHGILFLGWLLYFLYRNESTSALISSFFW